MYKHLKITLTLLVLTAIFLSLLSGCGTDSSVPDRTPPVENSAGGSQVAPDAGDDSDLPETPEPSPQPEAPSPLSISTSKELQEELYAAISEVRQPLPMEVSQMVWDQRPEIDLRNLYYELIGQHPELKYAYDITAELYHQFQEQNINLIGVGTDSGEGEEQLETAQNILKEKGVTYVNISPDPEGEFYKDFISEIFSYPTTYIVDGEGNIIGAPIIGNVKKQIDTVNERLELISE